MKRVYTLYISFILLSKKCMPYQHQIKGSQSMEKARKKEITRKNTHLCQILAKM